MTHIVPINDLKEHTESPDCFCAPKWNREAESFVHNSLDGREYLERAIHADTPEESLKHYGRYQQIIWTSLKPTVASRLNAAAFARLFAAWQANGFNVVIETNKDA
jgi:hypothetical protein